MSGSIGATERHVLPRWREATETARLGELGNAISATTIPDGQLLDLRDKELQWRSNPTVIGGAEFVAAAMLALKPELSVEAAEFILGSTDPDTPVIELAKRNLEMVSGPPDSAAEAHVAISKAQSWHVIVGLKRRLRLDPRNAAAWSDLSLQYSVLGQIDKAENAMQVALALAPQNRLVLRAATSLLVHADDPEQAHRLLTRSESIGKDPWITAAELAVAPLAERQPRFVKAARALLADDDLSPFHKNELASALATLELSHGQRKKARALFGTALEAPNENSLAQAEWASQTLHGLTVEKQVLAEPQAREARARLFYQRADWPRAAAEAWGWLSDQPFAPEPASFGSCVAEMGLRDFDQAILFATYGLKANPGNPTLLNNLAFAQIESGDLEQANTTLSRVPNMELSDAVAVTCKATAGLLAFRQGRVEDGRHLYREAIQAASRLGLRERWAMAKIMFAREEWRLNGPIALPVIKEAVAASRDFPDALIQLCVDMLIDSTNAKPAVVI